MAELVPGVEYDIVPVGPGMVTLVAGEALPIGQFVRVDDEGQAWQYTGPRLAEHDVAVTAAAAGERIVVALRQQAGYLMVGPAAAAGQFLKRLPPSPWRMTLRSAEGPMVVRG